jgi:hypothetical protein
VRTTVHGPSGMSTGAAGISDAPNAAPTRSGARREGREQRSVAVARDGDSGSDTRVRQRASSPATSTARRWRAVAVAVALPGALESRTQQSVWGSVVAALARQRGPSQGCPPMHSACGRTRGSGR